MADALYDRVFRPWRIVGETRVRASDATWRKPFMWDSDSAERQDVKFARPMRVLVDVDPFEDWHGDILDSDGRLHVVNDKMRQPEYATIADLRRDLFSLIDSTAHLDWLLRTRCPENVRRMMTERIGDWKTVPNRRNIWLGVQVEDQATADTRIPELLRCRDLVPVLWADADPLVGPVDLDCLVTDWEIPINSLRGEETRLENGETVSRLNLDLVTIGGDVGPEARPCNVDWIRSLVRQCADADVACWVKNIGSRACHELPDCGDGSGYSWDTVKYHMRDKDGADPAEWPEDIRVRQLPEVRT